MSAECGRNHPGPCAWVGKGGPLEPICLQPERPEPPVTADHTPEARVDLNNPAVIVTVNGFLATTTERQLLDTVVALRAECDALREQTARVEALMKRRDLGPVGFRRALDAALHPLDPDQERTSG